MLRQIIVPAQNAVVLHLPDKLLGKKVEIIAFSDEDIAEENNAGAGVKKKTAGEAIAFFKANAIDFSKIEKWTREDLYE